MHNHYIWRFCLIFSLLITTSCKQEDGKIQPNIKAVKLYQVSSNDAKNFREISGAIAPSDSSALSFRVRGQVTSIKVKQGDIVKKGDILAALKQEEYQTALNSSKASYQSAQADLKKQEQNVTRQRSLYDQELISSADMESAEKDYDNAVNNLDIAKANLSDAEQNLNDTLLRAPFDGTIAQVDADLFTEVMAGQMVLTLQSSAAFEVNILMPETLINKITREQEVKVKIPALNNTMLDGIISEIGTQAQGGNAYSVVVSLNDNDLALFDGMTAVTYFKYHDDELPANTVYLVPTTAIDLRYYDDEGKANKTASLYVYQQDQNNPNQGVLEKREITINDIRQNMLEVASGLEPGDLIVTAGVSYLSSGQIVKPWKPEYKRSAKEDL